MRRFPGPPSALVLLLLGCTPEPTEPTGVVPGTPTGTNTSTTSSTDTTTSPTARPDPELDAILDWPGTRTYFFRDADYIRYDTDNGEADAGYPLDTATYWTGVSTSVDAATRVDDQTAWFFRGSEVVRYDVAADTAIDTLPIDRALPGAGDTPVEAAAVLDGTALLFRGPELWVHDLASDTGARSTLADRFPDTFPEGVDAALPDGRLLHLFQGDRFKSFDLDSDAVVDEGRWVFAWPGLWDPHEGTGDPSANLPGPIADLLADDPSADEIAARKARVAASIVGTDYVDLSGDYPQYLASVEDFLGVWGCLLLYDPTRVVHRFRCATDTAGALPLDMAPLQTDWIDWSNAAYHVDQVSQGDFSADAGTPLSIHEADGDVFWIERVSANAPSGSISGGLNVRVRFERDGVSHTVGFSHLNTRVPRYVLDAEASGDPLAVGTAFGFIGYTGNLWIAPPPAVDGPYTGTGAGLPVSHSHLWFADDLDNHMGLTREMREALDYSGRYPYGGG